MRTALVTGANRGIGAKIAERLAALDHGVILGVRDPHAATDLLGRITEAGGQCRVEQVDTGDPDSIRDLTDRLLSASIDVDILINNAAVLLGEDLLKMPDDDVVASIRVNCLGPLRLIRALAPGMVERAFGRVVNVSSGWGTLDELGPGAYGITKAMLNAITVKTAAELPSSVKVNAACPGWVRTEMGGSGAPLTPDDGADTPVYLANLPDDGPTGRFFRKRREIPW